MSKIKKNSLFGIIYFFSLLIIISYLNGCSSCSSKDNSGDGDKSVFYLEGTISEDEVKKAIEFMPEPIPFPPDIASKDIVISSTIISDSIIQRSDIILRNDLFRSKKEVEYDQEVTLNENWGFKMTLPVNKIFNIIIGVKNQETGSTYTLGVMKSSKVTGLVSNLGAGDEYNGITISLELVSFKNGSFESDFFEHVDLDADGKSDAEDEDYDGNGTNDIEEENKIIVDGEEGNGLLNLAVGVEKSFEIKLEKEVAGSFSISEDYPSCQSDDSSLCCFKDNGNYTATLTCKPAYKPEEKEIGAQNIKLSYRDGENQELVSYLDIILIIRKYEHKIYTGGESICYIYEDGEPSNLKCWGFNNYGQLGLGNMDNYGDSAGELATNLPNIDLGDLDADVKISKVGMGSGYICALLTSGKIKCWGRNDTSQLGFDDNNSKGDEEGEMGNNLPFVDMGNLLATDIIAGMGHACGIFDDNYIRCWGINDDGQLGLENENVVILSAFQDRNLLKVDVGSNQAEQPLVPIALSSNSSSNCAITDDGRVICWGSNAYGQLGLGDKDNRGDEEGEMGDNISFVNLGTNKKVVSISVGSNHACALFEDGKVKCWGSNDYGQLGYGDSKIRGDDASNMGENLPYVDLGKNRIAYMISTGFGQTCALLDNLTVKCWGLNYGNIASGSIGDESNEMGDNLAEITFGENNIPIEISSESNQRCVRFTNKSIKCWGSNNNGQLGLGDVSNRSDVDLESMESININFM